MLLGALAKQPYPYYEILRFVVCGASAYSAAKASDSAAKKWAWALAGIAVLYNPVLPFHFGRGASARDVWAMLNAATAIVLGVSLFAPQGNRS